LTINQEKTMTTADSATQQGATDESQQHNQEQIDAARKAEEEAKATAAAEEERRKAAEEEMRARAQDPRRTAIDEIAQRRNESMASELAYIPEDGKVQKTAEELDDEAAEVERKRLETEAKAAEDAERQRQIKSQTEGDGEVLSADAIGKFRVRQVIDGVEREVPLAEALRTAQVSGAADFRLEKATEVLKRAEDLVREAESKAGGKKPAKGADDQPDAEARIKEAVEKMVDGDTEGAAKVLAETIAASSKSRDGVDPEAIASSVMYRVKMDQAFTSFQTEYKDVVGDKVLGPAVDREFQRIVPKDEKGQAKHLSPDEFSKTLRTAGESVRGWRDNLTGGKKPTAEELAAQQQRTREQKKAEKEDLDQTTGAARRSTTTTETTSAEPTPATRSQTVQEIAKARGQVI
jgi:hypothetical protein